MKDSVEGYVICNKQGQVLRRYPNMSLERAEHYASTMISLTSQARGVVRDLDPKVRCSTFTGSFKILHFDPYMSPLIIIQHLMPQNELRYLRIRAKKHEVMVAFGEQHSSALISSLAYISLTNSVFSSAHYSAPPVE